MRILSLFAMIFTASFAWSLEQNSTEAAKRLFSRLTGTPIYSRDSRLYQMVEHLEIGEDIKAARIAMDDENFYAVTLRNWASVMSNQEETPFVQLDDFQFLMIGLVRDELDARLLLYGDIAYTRRGLLGNPGNFDIQVFERLGLSFKTDLVRIKQSDIRPDVEPAGLLTTNAWAKAHFSAGTNRRAVKYAMQEFLCAPIDEWKTPGLDARFIRQDVDRLPGKNPQVFRDQCQSCHAPMDAMAGAFAYLNYEEGPSGGLISQSETTQQKYLQNSGVYPEGNATLDNSWVNLLAPSVLADRLGWGETQKGYGPQSFGKMLSDTKGFKTCMVQRIFETICQRKVYETEKPILRSIARDFSSNGHNLKYAFARVALLPACMGGLE